MRYILSSGKKNCRSWYKIWLRTTDSGHFDSFCFSIRRKHFSQQRMKAFTSTKEFFWEIFPHTGVTGEGDKDKDGGRTTKEQGTHMQRHWGVGWVMVCMRSWRKAPVAKARGRDEAEGETEALGLQRPWRLWSFSLKQQSSTEGCLARK